MVAADEEWLGQVIDKYEATPSVLPESTLPDILLLCLEGALLAFLSFAYDTPVRLTAGHLTGSGVRSTVIRAELRRVIQTAMRAWPDLDDTFTAPELDYFHLLVSGLRVGCPGEGLELAEHGRDELRNRRVNVHRALNDCVRRFGVHDVQDRMNNLVTAGAQDGGA